MSAKLSGVYIITNAVSPRVYVGSAVDIESRRRGHWGALNRGTHHNPALQAAWKKYGSEAFSFAVLEVVAPRSRDALLAAEQRWLNHHGAGDAARSYNYLTVAGSHLGRKRSSETRARLSIANLGKKASVEAKARMRAAKLGRKQKPEHIAKVLPHLHAANARRWQRDRGKPSEKRKLDNEQVREFFKLRGDGWTLHDLRRHFRIGFGTAQRLASWETYKELRCV